MYLELGLIRNAPCVESRIIRGGREGTAKDVCSEVCRRKYRKLMRTNKI